MALFMRQGQVLRRRVESIIITNSISSYSLPTHRNYASSSPTQQQATITEAPAVPDSINEGHERARTTAKVPGTGAIIRPVHEVPGPRRFPLFGSMLSIAFDKDFKREKQDVYWRKLKKEYGDLVRVDFPGMGPMVILFNPIDVETLSRVTMQNPIRKGGNVFKKIREDDADNYFDKRPGLIPSNYEEWHRVRKRVQTPMMKPKNVGAYLAQVDEVTLEFLDRVADFQTTLGEMPRDFQTEIYKWALESISLVALNRRMGCLAPNLPDDSTPMTMIKEIHNLFEGLNQTEFGAHIWKYFPTPTYIKVKRSHDTFKKLADENIRQTEAQLLAKDPNSEELTLMETLLLTPGLTRTDVVTLILDMLFAGVDTVGHTLGFALYLLAKNPKVQTKLQEEIDSVLADHKGPLTPKHLAQLSYLKSVVKESMRVFPVTLGTIRTLEQNTVFGNYLIPKGFIVGSWNSIMAEDERLFPRAKEFIPERWAREKPLGDINAFAHLPFGFGTRVCIGRRIAEQEIYTFLARFLQRFEVEYHYQDIGSFSRMVNAPSEPLIFKVTER